MNHIHGKTGSPEWKIWVDMRKRCSKWKHPHFARYGGRGIRVCPRWAESFAAFLADVGVRPSPKHTLDRIDNDRGYEPGNVRWATRREQARNRRTSRLITARGKTQTLAAWSEELSVKSSTIRMRLTNGWPVERALS